MFTNKITMLKISVSFMYIYMHIKCDVTFFLLLRLLGLIRPKKLVNSSYALTFNARNCTRTILYIILAINRKAILEKLNTNLMKKKIVRKFYGKKQNAYNLSCEISNILSNKKISMTIFRCCV